MNRGPQDLECRDCGATFGTKRGLGVHRRNRHPTEVNREIDLGRVRRNWSDEELLIMAEIEYRVRQEGYRGNINDRLAERTPGRSADSIKKARSKQSYRDFLRDISIEEDMGNGEPQGSFGEEEDRMANRTALLRAICQLVDEISEKPVSVVVEGLLGLAREAIAGRRVIGDIGRVIKRLLVPVGPDEPVVQEVVGRPRRDGTVRVGPQVERRRQYARLQGLWRKDKKVVWQELSSDGRLRQGLDAKIFRDYWAPIVENPSTPYAGGEIRGQRIAAGVDLWVPIAEHEVVRLAPDHNSAAGLDGVSPCAWKVTPWRIKALVLNLIMLEGMMPEDLLRSRVTMVPKCDAVNGPGDFRPISVSSVIVRHFHKILAARMESVTRHENEQKGFIRGYDGIAHNVFLLDGLLRMGWRKKRSLVISILDVRKAFDSVSHDALREILLKRGFQCEIRNYIRSTYANAKSVIISKGRAADEMKPARGVRQGDPLSPILFNMVMDHVLASLPKKIGFWMGGRRISALAYADDLVLVSSTISGMSRLLREVEERLGECGLQLNPAKCLSVAIEPSAQRRMVKLVEGDRFTVGGIGVEAADMGRTWQYLGVEFDHEGVRPGQVNIEEAIAKISRAPLKPQQKLTLLREFLIPSVLHRLVLGVHGRRWLNAVDVIIRKAIRGWLHLPVDVPGAFFHTPIRYGGIGIPRLLRMVPFWREKRMAGVRQELEEKGITDDVRGALGKGYPMGEIQPNPSLIESDRLYERVDGIELRGMEEVRASRAWVYVSADQISGSEYVRFLKLLIGALPTRMRTTRGSRRIGTDVACRGCGWRQETAAHIIQRCPLTHGGRTLRHDALVKRLEADFGKRGYRVFRETTVAHGLRKRRPDLIVSKGGLARILDVQVISGRLDRDAAGQAKIERYGCPWVIRAVAALTGVEERRIEVIPVTLSWKGLWSKLSAKELKKIGMNDKALEWLTERTLRGSVMNFTRWKRMAGVA